MVLGWCNVTCLPGGNTLSKSILPDEIELFNFDLHSHGIGV